MRCTFLSLAAAAVLVCSSAANAALITADGVTDNATTDLGNTNVAAASDGDTDGFGAATTGMWFTPAPGGFPSDYFDTGTPPVLTFTFSSDVELDAIAFWAHGFGGPNDNSVQWATLEFRNNGGSIETLNFNTANLGNVVQQDFDLQTDLGLSTNTVTVDEIVMAISDNYSQPGGSAAGGDRVGFADIQFNAIPEPSSFALVGLALFGLVGVALRRG